MKRSASLHLARQLSSQLLVTAELTHLGLWKKPFICWELFWWLRFILEFVSLKMSLYPELEQNCVVFYYKYKFYIYSIFLLYLLDQFLSFCWSYFAFSSLILFYTSAPLFPNHFSEDYDFSSFPTYKVNIFGSYSKENKNGRNLAHPFLILCTSNFCMYDICSQNANPVFRIFHNHTRPQAVWSTTHWKN